MSPEEQLLHIVILHSGIILSRKSHMSWREVSDEYDDYMTSLGPWPVSSVIDFIKEEWPDLQCEDVIAQFIQSDSETLSILSDS